jgi:phospholipid/cholesterol/gamma-HCH transport system permease protein
MNNIQNLGRSVVSSLRSVGSISVLLYRAILNVRYIHTDRVLYIMQMYELGIRAMPLVIVISVFSGAVAGWQGAYQLSGKLPVTFLGSAIATGILVEMGPVLTALVLAGRNGSSIAAEIATMVVTEQVDALEAMAINPIRHLVTPRVITMIIMMPLLVAVGDIVAIFSGAWVVDAFYNINFDTYFNSIHAHFILADDIYPGLFKALSFGLSVGLVSCWVGLKATKGASGVGKAAIQAFVYSSATVLVGDFIVAIIVF